MVKPIHLIIKDSNAINQWKCNTQCGAFTGNMGRWITVFQMSARYDMHDTGFTNSKLGSYTTMNWKYSCSTKKQLAWMVDKQLSWKTFRAPVTKFYIGSMSCHIITCLTVWKGSYSFVILHCVQAFVEYKHVS